MVTSTKKAFMHLCEAEIITETMPAVTPIAHGEQAAGHAYKMSVGTKLELASELLCSTRLNLKHKSVTEFPLLFNRETTSH